MDEYGERFACARDAIVFGDAGFEELEDFAGAAEGLWGTDATAHGVGTEIEKMAHDFDVVFADGEVEGQVIVDGGVDKFRVGGGEGLDLGEVAVVAGEKECPDFGTSRAGVGVEIAGYEGLRLGHKVWGGTSYDMRLFAGRGNRCELELLSRVWLDGDFFG